MASVADYGEEFDMDTGEQREEIRKECFRILFQYLRSKDVVKKCFIDKLPTHITSIDNNKNIWKGLNNYLNLLSIFKTNIFTLKSWFEPPDFILFFLLLIVDDTCMYKKTKLI